jgi:glycosyltransferase involved in cell wall biosynthesis
MLPKLSIIIPCFNCQKTLTEALDSCYQQGFSEDEFEIIMIDDGSTDGTLKIIQNLASIKNNITTLQHKENRGGGAARNTGIEAAQSDKIITFDSDDILGKEVLKKMVAQLESNKKNIDGVVFGYTFTFQNQLSKAKKSDISRPDGDKSLTFYDIFSGRDWGVGMNFMFTKRAWYATGGYPEHHPLDTQGFGIRFLGEGFKTQTCTKAFFYHRQFANEPSYFERAYADGYLSIGYFLSYFEYLYKFSPRVQHKLLSFDIFQNNTISKNSIQKMLTSAYSQDPQEFLSRSNEIDSVILRCCQAWKVDDFNATLLTLLELKKQLATAHNLDYMILFTLSKINNKQSTVADVASMTTSFLPAQKKLTALRVSKLKKIAVAIKNMLYNLSHAIRILLNGLRHIP